MVKLLVENNSDYISKGNKFDNAVQKAIEMKSYVDKSDDVCDTISQKNKINKSIEIIDYLIQSAENGALGETIIDIDHNDHLVETLDNNTIDHG